MTEHFSHFLLHLCHQAVFGGVAAVGFAVLFNCRPRMLPVCFGAGMLALGVRTAAQESGFTLPVASFLAALTLACAEHFWKRLRSPRGSILAVVGAIPMVPGSLAAKVLLGAFMLLRTGPGQELKVATDTWENGVVLLLTLASIGIALALPDLATRQPDSALETRSFPNIQLSPNIQTSNAAEPEEA